MCPDVCCCRSRHNGRRHHLRREHNRKSVRHLADSPLRDMRNSVWYLQHPARGHHDNAVREHVDSWSCKMTTALKKIT